MDATYLASTLGAHTGAQPAQPAKTAEQRLQELQTLRDKGLVTNDEYEAQWQQILGSI